MMGTTGDERRYFDVGHGFAVVWTSRVHHDDRELPHILDLDLDVEDGRLVVVGFSARRRQNGPAITADTLKQMPVVGALRRKKGVGHRRSPHIARRLDDGTWADALKRDLDAVPELERAAILYRVGLFLGLPPTQHVAKGLDVTPAVAAKRVQAARRAGLLEATTPGKKGA